MPINSSIMERNPEDERFRGRDLGYFLGKEGGSIGFLEVTELVSSATVRKIASLSHRESASQARRNKLRARISRH